MFAGVDIGGTKIEAAVVTSTMELVGSAYGATDITTPTTIVSGIAEALRAACASAGMTLATIKRIGVGVPGQVADGQVNLAVNLNLDHFPLAAAISDRVGVPCLLENDVRIAATGAWQYLWGNRSTGTLAYLNFGTGVSAGVVINGELYRGSHGMAGEIGHVIVEPDGDLCACGLRGCLETIASGAAVMRQIQSWGLEPLLLTYDSLPRTRNLYRAARDGHATAQALVRRISRAIATAVQWVVMAWDVEQVIFGGGLTRAGEGFLEAVRAELATLRTASHVAALMLPDDKFCLLPDGYNAGLWGAVRLASR